jgi:hypothetical protein
MKKECIHARHNRTRLDIIHTRLDLIHINITSTTYKFLYFGEHSFAKVDHYRLLGDVNLENGIYAV